MRNALSSGISDLEILLLISDYWAKTKSLFLLSDLQKWIQNRSVTSSHQSPDVGIGRVKITDLVKRSSPLQQFANLRESLLTNHHDYYGTTFGIDFSCFSSQKQQTKYDIEHYTFPQCIFSVLSLMSRELSMPVFRSDYLPVLSTFFQSVHCFLGDPGKVLEKERFWGTKRFGGHHSICQSNIMDHHAQACTHKYMCSIINCGQDLTSHC